MEYLPLALYALVFFVGPIFLGGVWLWWLWRGRHESRRSDDRSQAA